MLVPEPEMEQMTRAKCGMYHVAKWGHPLPPEAHLQGASGKGRFALPFDQVAKIDEMEQMTQLGYWLNQVMK